MTIFLKNKDGKLFIPTHPDPIRVNLAFGNYIEFEPAIYDINGSETIGLKTYLNNDSTFFFMSSDTLFSLYHIKIHLSSILTKKYRFIKSGIFLFWVYVSIFCANTAFVSIKSLRGSTLSPIKISNSWSQSIASSTLTLSNVLVEGSIVVSQSC